MKKLVVVKASFEGLHCWATCPIPEVEYLKNPHRHIFNVRVKLSVEENDRQVEFIQFKHTLREAFQVLFPMDTKWKIFNLGSMSCEMMATDIFNYLNHHLKYTNIHSIEVDEDGENGVEFIWG